MDRTEPKVSTESAGAPVALVNSADKGIGLETAPRLGEAGHRVYLTARNSERGRAAAATDDSHAGKGYLLTGPQALTARQQVATIAEVTGRPIDFQDVTPNEFAQAAIQQGTPPEQGHLFGRLNEVFRARRSVNITDDVENITGTAPVTFRDWCERHAAAFR